MPHGVKNQLWITFKERLYRLRRSTKLSGSDLGRLAGCTGQYLRLMERGLCTPCLDLVERAGLALTVSPIWLAYGPEGYLKYRLRRVPGTVERAYPAPIPAEVSADLVTRHLSCGERMQQRRKKAKLSLRELVEKVNEPAGELRVSYMTVYNTEIGKSIPRLDNLESIAVALDVPPGWLAFGDDPD